MDVSLLVLLIIAGVLPLAGFVVGLVFFILFLVKSLGGTTGGWRRLTEVYSTANPSNGQITKRETIEVGAVTYKQCESPWAWPRRNVLLTYCEEHLNELEAGA